jgi:hypothetical protein
MISYRSLRKETSLAEKLRYYIENNIPLILENSLNKKSLDSVSIRISKIKDELGNLIYTSE